MGRGLREELGGRHLAGGEIEQRTTTGQVGTSPSSSSYILILDLNISLSRLVRKGKRPPDYTRDLIMKKLTDDDDGIATTNLKVTVSCPLGEETESAVFSVF